MFKFIMVVGCMIAAVFTQAGDAVFKPQIEKLTINGTVLYQAGEKTGQTLEVDSSWPVKIEYSLKNSGTVGSAQPLTVFVHFVNGDNIVMSGDFEPDQATTAWTNGQVSNNTKTVSMGNLKDKDVQLFVGMYDPKGVGQPRFPLENKERDADCRVFLGTLKVK